MLEPYLLILIRYTVEPVDCSDSAQAPYFAFICEGVMDSRTWNTNFRPQADSTSGPKCPALPWKVSLWTDDAQCDSVLCLVFGTAVHEWTDSFGFVWIYFQVQWVLLTKLVSRAQRGKSSNNNKSFVNSRSKSPVYWLIRTSCWSRNTWPIF